MEDLIFTCTIGDVSDDFSFEDEVTFTMKPIPDFEGAWDFEDIAEFVTNMPLERWLSKYRIAPDCRRKIALQCREAGWVLIGIRVKGEER